ncbi:MAG: Spy/CpxP family protein refolding chaperone [Blastocatellia bacterium]
MNKRIFLVLGVALAVIAGGLIAGARMARASSNCEMFQGRGGPGPQGRPHGPEDFALRGLDLTDEQKAKIKTLHEAARDSSEPYLEQLKQIHDELDKAIETAEFNEAAVRAIAAKRSSVELELNVIRARTQSAVWNLLTPAQRTKLAQRREQMKQHHPDGPPPVR